MALTLRSSTFFINQKETKKILKASDELSIIRFPKVPKLSIRRRAKSSMKEEAHVTCDNNNNNNKSINAEVIRRKEEPEKVHSPPSLFVMLPLDTVTMGGQLNKPRAMNASLMALKSAGVEGVMVDVWWGLVEKDGPLKYNWEGYAELVKMVQRHGLKLQAVMSFHQCGGNVGDSCSIPLPPWVLEEISKNPDLVYTDRLGRRNLEYISLGCDSLPVLNGRTPLQVYSDYMKSFCDRFRDYLGSVIIEIQVGLGPSGELRYPSSPESNGIGEFQCYDKYMRASSEALAKATGKKDRGGGGPHDSGQYNNSPEAEHEQFFLDWYSSKLVEHGARILVSAKSIFQDSGVNLSAKVAATDRHHKAKSHGAEGLTAGYCNTRLGEDCLPIAQMLAKHGIVFNFTCMEMKDKGEAEHAGENTMERYDEGAFSQVLSTSKSECGCGLAAFTYLRMNKRLFKGENWRQLVEFVRSVDDGGRGRTTLV